MLNDVLYTMLFNCNDERWLAETGFWQCRAHRHPNTPWGSRSARYTNSNISESGTREQRSEFSHATRALCRLFTALYSRSDVTLGVSRVCLTVCQKLVWYAFDPSLSEIHLGHTMHRKRNLNTGPERNLKMRMRKYLPASNIYFLYISFCCVRDDAY